MHTARRMIRIAILLLACALTGALLSCSNGFYVLMQNVTPGNPPGNPLYVIYDANGATGGTVPDDPAIYHTGFIVTTTGNTGTLTRGGFTFAGWNTMADGTGTTYSQGQTFTINSDVILYARWTSNPTYLLNYNGNDNTGGTVPSGPASYEQGQLVTVLDNTGSFVRTGFAFNGWNTAANGSGTPYTQGNTFAMPTSNVTLYAQWTADPTYTISYDGNGNDAGIPPTDSTNYKQGNTVTVLDNTGNLTKIDFTFVRWNTAANGSGTDYNPGATFSMGTASVTLYAQWAPTYTVTCYGNGSTGGIPPVDSNRYAAGQNWTVPDQGTLVRTGHSFTGWNSDAGGGGTAYTVGQIVPMGSANVSLYAQWSSIAYQVSYDGNGSTGGTYPAAPASYAPGQTVNVLGNTGNYTRAGFSFVRWNTMAGGTGTPYDPGASFTMPSAAVTLYAQWQEPGALDLTFDPGSGANSIVWSITVQSDGKILIGGDFTSYDGTGRNRIARLNADGSLDTTFNPGTGANSSVRSIVVQSNGKILIGGDFTFYNGTEQNRIARLNADGSLDTTFNPGTGATSSVRSIAVQSDGKILIAGEFTFYNGTGREHIARLNANGSLDTTFNPGTGANSNVWSVTVQSNGKILIGGEFTSYNGTGRNRIARLITNGTLDASFDPGSGANSSVRSIVVQSDGKILIGGDFTFYNGTGQNRIARLNAGGSLDASFNPGSGASDYLNSIAVQSDGKILIGGHFTSCNGTGRNRIARLNTNGTLDTSFNPGSGANDRVLSIAVLSDGRILIGGEFTSYNGTGRSYIALIIQ